VATAAKVERPVGLLPGNAVQFRGAIRQQVLDELRLSDLRKVRFEPGRNWPGSGAPVR
jgi:hypothetical protein